MILNQDKYTLRNTLSTMNDKLYKTVDSALKNQMSRKISGARKRVKFANSKRDSFKGEKKNVKFSGFKEKVNPRKRMSVQFEMPSRREQYRDRSSPRKSIMSTVIENIRETQNNQQQNKIEVIKEEESSEVE